MNFEGYLGKDIPKLGFGLMRLPRLEDASAAVDMPQFKAMVDMFLDAGFTYFDTAYGYADSEVAAKEALVDRYPRESFQLATKLPAWNAKTQAEAEAMFYTSLERTGAGYFDYYLLHNFGAHRSAFFDRYHIWEFLAERKAEGLIKNLGFSLHDKADLLDKLLTEHPETDFVQLQINYADWESPSIQSRLCYETALAHNTPVVLMEPVKGGSLATLPESVRRVFAEADPTASPASWALRYAGSLDGIITVLSGMSDLEQMSENIALFSDFKPLDASEREVIARILAELEKLPTIACTSCGYCLNDCPENIAIPGIFETMNELTLFGNERGAKFGYSWETKGHKRRSASACSECGACEEVCPQQLPIRKHLKEAVALFE
ncbi:MAG TPA: Fe-S oxidoreductase [Coriobacteriia bacterium]|nr:Fe-S oxidoreductase [Coriobacteriia bacterium]